VLEKKAFDKKAADKKRKASEESSEARSRISIIVFTLFCNGSSHVENNAKNLRARILVSLVAMIGGSQAQAAGVESAR